MTTPAVQHDDPTVGKVLPDLDFQATDAHGTTVLELSAAESTICEHAPRQGGLLFIDDDVSS